MNIIGTARCWSGFWLQGCALLVLLAPSLTVAQEYRAVERRLGEAVADGILSLKQAVVMMDALKESSADLESPGRRIGAWVEAVGNELKAAVRAGVLSEGEAWAQWEQFKETEMNPELEAAIHTAEMTPDAVAAFRHRIRRAEEAERLKWVVARGEMTEAQARAKWAEISEQLDREFRAGHQPQSVEEQFRELGVSAERLGQLKQALTDAGFKPEQLEGALVGVVRVVHETKAKGEGTAPAPELMTYFATEVGLADEQIRATVEHARNLVKELTAPAEEPAPDKEQ